MLRFSHLQEALRSLLWSRIESGELTGMALAEKTGFRQAHVSNFLNRKRGLSLAGMDRVLAVEDLSLMDLVPPDEINQRASIPPPSEDDYENILLVDLADAGLPQVPARNVLEVVKLKQSLLRRLHPENHHRRSHWLRFVAVKPDRASCEAMAPRLAPGCTVLLDRHYHTLASYRRNEKTMYAVRVGQHVLLRYAHRERACLGLEAHAPSVRTRMLHLAPGTRVEDLILGRVAHVSMEL